MELFALNKSISDFIMKRLINKWHNYKYRFVPWVAFNIYNRSPRFVGLEDQDKIISDDEITKCLVHLLPHFYRADGHIKNSILASKNREAMTRAIGFTVERAPSTLPGMKNGSLGVFVRNGDVPKGSLVALYPGTIYHRYEPILIQSLRNSFIFRCLDGILIDGKDTGLSKVIYKSCVGRDLVGGMTTSDLSWLTPDCINPLNIGQYVNNQSKDVACNVAYQEVQMPEDGSVLPFPLLSLLPNIFYSSNLSSDIKRNRRLIALVSVVDIPKDAEILSSYYTLVH